MPTLLSGSTLNFVASQTGQVLRVATSGGFCTVTGAFSFTLGPLPARRAIGPLSVGDIVNVVANSGDLVYEVGIAFDGNYNTPLAGRDDVTGTWAQVYASATKAIAGASAYATDLRLRFISDGTYWRPAGGRALLFNGGADFTMALNTTEQVAYSYTMPAGLLMPFGFLLFCYGAERTGGTSDTLTTKLTMNGASLGQPPMVTTVVTLGAQKAYQRLSTTTVRQIGGGNANQVGPLVNTGTPARPGAVTVANMDTTANVIQLTGTLTLGTETGIFSGFTIELIG